MTPGGWLYFHKKKAWEDSLAEPIRQFYSNKHWANPYFDPCPVREYHRNREVAEDMLEQARQIIARMDPVPEVRCLVFQELIMITDYGSRRTYIRLMPLVTMVNQLPYLPEVYETRALIGPWIGPEIDKMLRLLGSLHTNGAWRRKLVRRGIRQLVVFG
jgi:hypothetical protein